MKQECQYSQNRCERRFWRIALIVALSPFIVGCSLTTSATPDDVNVPSTVSERAPANEVWQALARAVQARTIETTTRLGQCVVILARNGDLTDQDVAAFDVAFPQISSESRALTDVDMNVLIELGRKAK